MVQIQSGNGKPWVIFISNPKWNAWIGKRKQLRLWLETTKPWLVTFSTSDDGKTLFAEASVEFMNGVADAHSVEIKDENKQYLLTSVDMKDSAATIVAIANCVSEHAPASPGPSPNPETTISGTGFFVRAARSFHLNIAYQGSS
jgi:hypothetical protein